MNTQETTNNVFTLPIHMDEQHLKNAEETITHMKDIRKDFSDEIVEFAMEQTIACIQQFGALHDGRRCKTQDYLMLENAISSLVYRYYNLEHPLQSITDDVFVMGDEESETDESEETPTE